MSWNLKKNHMHMQVLEFSANRISTESNWNYCFSVETNQNSKLSCRNLEGRRQPAALEKESVLVKRSIIHKHNFWPSGESNFRRNAEKKTYVFSILFNRDIFFDWGLDGRISDSCFEENWVQLSRGIKAKFRFDFFGISRFRWNEPNAIFSL